MEIVRSRPISLGVGALLTSQSLLCFLFPEVMKYFSLVPANLLITNNFIWTLVTSSFLETNPLKYLLDVILLVLISHELQITQLDQMGLYFLLNIVSCGVGSLFWLLYRFYLSNSDSYLLEGLYGFGGVLMGLIMFSRQQLKSTPIVAKYPFLTFNYLPTFVLFFYSLLWILGINFCTIDISFYWISYFFSWTYLRFFYRYSVSTLPSSTWPHILRMINLEILLMDSLLWVCFLRLIFALFFVHSFRSSIRSSFPSP
jgi:hypothetical protein